MKTVAIVGSHPATRDNGPWEETCDLWVFNEAAQKDWCKRFTGVFQMHLSAVYRSRYNRSDRGHWDWLQKRHGIPIWMQDVDPLVPDSVQYPLEELIDKLKCERYFTSGIAYALALTAYLDYEKVLMYGIEMKSQTEYHYQRQCIRYWIGFMEGRGIQIEWHCADDLFSDPLYGYEGNLEMNVGELVNHKMELEKMVKTLKIRRTELEILLDEVLSRLEDPVQAMADLSDNVHELGWKEGMLSESNKFWRMAVDLEMEHGVAYFDRSRFEIDGASEREKIEEKSAGTMRKAGRMDVAVTTYLQRRDEGAIRLFKQYWKMYQDDNYEFGFTQGIAEENKRLRDDIDRRILAAGGKKATAMMMEDYQTMEVDYEGA